MYHHAFTCSVINAHLLENYKDAIHTFLHLQLFKKEMVAMEYICLTITEVSSLEKKV